MGNSTKVSLEMLEGKWISDIPKENYSSSIQLRTYNLYRKNLIDFEIDDIRFMIVQKMGLKILIPSAINYLKEKLLVESSYYEGDLLHSLLLIPKAFWENNPELYRDVSRVLVSNKEQLKQLNESYDMDKKLLQDYEEFIKFIIM